MATGPEHYAEAEKLLTRADDYPYGDDRENAAFRGAQVHATLALAAATALAENAAMPSADFHEWATAVGSVAAGSRDDEPPLVWWLDDGEENPGKPPLYTSEAAARAAAIKRYEHDNPFTDTFPDIVSWQQPEEEDATEDAELSVKGRRTGIIVRPVQPKVAV